MRVLAVEKGKLVNYLLGRQPIRDFPELQRPWPGPLACQVRRSPTWGTCSLPRPKVFRGRS